MTLGVSLQIKCIVAALYTTWPPGAWLFEVLTLWPLSLPLFFSFLGLKFSLFLHFPISLIISVSEFLLPFPCLLVLPLRLYSKGHFMNLLFLFALLISKVCSSFSLSISFSSYPVCKFFIFPFSFLFFYFFWLLFALWVFRIRTPPPPFSLVFHG